MRREIGRRDVMTRLMGRVVKLAALSFGTFVLVLGIAEAVVRGLDLAPALVPIPIGELRAVADRELMWTNNPDAEGINELGFRGPELRTDRDRIRILVLGDSVAFGTGLEESRSIPRRLEIELRKRGVESEVLNAAVPGYDSRQQARALELLPRSLEIDFVVVLYCLNDAFTTPGFPENLKRASRREGKLDEVGELLALARGSAFRRRVVRESHLARLVVALVERDRGDLANTRESIHEVGFAKAVRDLTRVSVAFRRIDELGRLRGVPIALAIAPLYRTAKDGFSEPDVHVAVAALATKSGLLAIDLLEPVREHAASTGGELGQKGDPVHPTAEGAAVTARALADQLIEHLPRR